MQKRKCFSYEEWDHIVKNCRVKKQKKVTILLFSKKFEVLRSKVMNVGKEVEEKKEEIERGY